MTGRLVKAACGRGVTRHAQRRLVSTSRRVDVRTNSSERDGASRADTVEPSEELRERESSVSLGARLAERAELLAQSALALALGGALAVSTLNILAKVGVITFALVSVAVRYVVVGVLLVVLVACVLP